MTLSGPGYSEEPWVALESRGWSWRALGGPVEPWVILKSLLWFWRALGGSVEPWVVLKSHRWPWNKNYPALEKLASLLNFLHIISYQFYLLPPANYRFYKYPAKTFPRIFLILRYYWYRIVFYPLLTQCNLVRVEIFVCRKFSLNVEWMNGASMHGNFRSWAIKFT